MLVSPGPAVLQGKVDHRPQQYRRGQGVLACERFGGGDQNLVVILVDVVRAFEHQVCGSVESRLNEKLPTRPSAPSL